MATSYDGECIKGSVEDSGVLHLQMARAPVNAANSQFFFEIGHYFELAKDDDNVRAIVLSSAFPKYFTAGLDLKESSLEQKGTDPARKALRIKKHVLELQRAITQIADCDKPVISAIAGVAYGLAVDISCACDIRYTSSDAIFSIKEVDIGIAADIGTLSRLHRIIGNQSLARELAFTARPFSAKEALNLGFVSRVFEGGHQEVVDAALATARIIASKSPVAVVGTKHLLNYSQDHTVAEGLAYTALWNSAMMQTDDLKKAMSASLKKQRAQFAKL